MNHSIKVKNHSMEYTAIHNHNTLTLRIMEMKAEKSRQEYELKYAFLEFADTFSPLSMLKGSMKGMAKDKELRSDILKTGINLGTDFIIERVLGRNHSIKGFLGSILVEKFSTPFINNAVTKMLSGIGKRKNDEPEQDTTYSYSGQMKSI